jgi:hypothetical protein
MHKVVMNALPSHSIRYVGYPGSLPELGNDVEVRILKEREHFVCLLVINRRKQASFQIDDKAHDRNHH